MKFLSLFAFVASVTAWGVPSPYAFDRGFCQSPTKNPLEGCPPGTLLVGAGQKYATIQSAVLSLGNTTSPAVILIEPGNYTEQVRSARLTTLAKADAHTGLGECHTTGTIDTSRGDFCTK